ncbi:unnamed protein product [Arabis nemorensis]|uniref:Uncharacterized protein n=1 Tax=Arabis nemorensis TaxID=586526 RepID=A0A565CBE3_9BRAS|nr:unnamed protein product [Arabis nemorensis]
MLRRTETLASVVVVQAAGGDHIEFFFWQESMDANAFKKAFADLGYKLVEPYQNPKEIFDGYIQGYLTLGILSFGSEIEMV